MPFSEQTEPFIQSIPPDEDGGEPRKFRGVNLLIDPRRISEDELVLAKNIFPVSPEILSHRGSMQPFGCMVANPTDGVNPYLPVNSYIPPLAGTYAVVWASRNVAAGQNTVIWAGNPQPLGAATSSTLPGVVTTRKPGFCSFIHQVFVALGDPYNAHAGLKITAGGIAVFNFLDAAGSTLTPVGASAKAPQVMSPYRDMMTYANFGAGFESYLLISDGLSSSSTVSSANRPYTVAPTGGGLFSRALQVGGQRDTDAIVAMKEVMLTAVGGPPQSGLLILKERTAYLLTGTPNPSTDTTDLPSGTVQIVQVAYNCGCSSPETVVTTPYGTIWAGQDDVWLFQYGQAPIRVGSKIRSVLQRTPAAFRYRWHAGYFNGIYRLALDSSSSVNDDSPCGEQWWLDLRYGPPTGGPEVQPHEDAMWWGPMVFKFITAKSGATQTGTRNMCQEDRNDFTSPYLMGIEFGFDDLSGTKTDDVMLVYYDNPNGRDESSQQAASAVGTTPTPNSLNDFDWAVQPAGTEIAGDIITKEYDLGDPRAQKLIQGVEASINVTDNVIITVNYFQDTIVAATDLHQIGGLDQLVDVDNSAGSIIVSRKMQGVQSFPAARVIGTTFQLEIQDYQFGGVYIVKGVNDSLVWVNVGGNKYYQVFINPGIYASWNAVLNALVAAMHTADSSFNYTHGLSGNAFTITISGGTWYPAFQSLDLNAIPPGAGQPNLNSAPSSVFRPGVWLFNRMGFTTTGGVTGTGTGLTGTTITAAHSVPNAVLPQWQLSGLAMNVLPFPRRPT